PRHGLPRVASWHLHVHRQPAVEGNDEAETSFVDLVPADHLLSRALEDPDDSSFRAIGIARALDADNDAIAVHRLIEIVPRDEDALGPVPGRVLGIHEAETARIRRD